MLNRMMALLCAAQILCYGAMLLLGDLRYSVPWCLCLFFTAFSLYGVTLILLKYRDEPVKRVKPSVQLFKKPFLMGLVLLTAVICRLVMVFSPPSLSDDIYRYLWEGKMTVSGINPYTTEPSDPELEPLRDNQVYPYINNNTLPAIYPPLSQLFFALISGMSYTVFSMKLLFVCFDLATMVVLLLTLRILNIQTNRIAIYALNPLVIMEFSGSGHLDSAGIFFLMFALYLLVKSKTLRGAAALSCSFLIKLLPLVLLPVMIKKNWKTSLLVFSVVAAFAYIPFLAGGMDIFYSLNVYSRTWVFNASLYELFLKILNNNMSARIAVCLIFSVCTLMAYIRYFRSVEQKISSYRLCFTVLGALLLLSPVMHPWYVCWIVPFLVILPNRAWIILSGTVFLSYWILDEYAVSGVWEEDVRVKLLVYVPFFSVMFYDMARKGLKNNREVK